MGAGPRRREIGRRKRVRNRRLPEQTVQHFLFEAPLVAIPLLARRPQSW